MSRKSNVLPLKSDQAKPRAVTIEAPKQKPGKKVAPFIGDNKLAHESDIGEHARRLMDAFGTPNVYFALEMYEQLANISSQGQQFDKHKTNFALSVVAGIEPRDQVEAMLAAQMAAVHMATMTFSRRLAHVENIMQQESAEKAFNKLARTFTAQVEALKRYRSKGEQRVYVERVNVEQGGQAIVGNVQHRGSEKNEG